MTLKVGDRILVDTSQYALEGPHWCDIVELITATASTFPIKVQVPGKGIGQYRREEIMDHHPATGRAGKRR